MEASARAVEAGEVDVIGERVKALAQRIREGDPGVAAGEAEYAEKAGVAAEGPARGLGLADEDPEYARRPAGWGAERTALEEESAPESATAESAAPSEPGDLGTGGDGSAEAAPGQWVDEELGTMLVSGTLLSFSMKGSIEAVFERDGVVEGDRLRCGMERPAGDALPALGEALQAVGVPLAKLFGLKGPLEVRGVQWQYDAETGDEKSVVIQAVKKLEVLRSPLNVNTPPIREDELPAGLRSALATLRMQVWRWLRGERAQTELGV